MDFAGPSTLARPELLSPTVTLSAAKGLGRARRKRFFGSLRMTDCLRSNEREVIMFRTASRRQRKKTSVRRLRLSAFTTYRPVLEYLEHRWLPSTNNFWIDGVAGYWNTAGNWSLG